MAAARTADIARSGSPRAGLFATTSDTPSTGDQRVEETATATTVFTATWVAPTADLDEPKHPQLAWGSTRMSRKAKAANPR